MESLTFDQQLAIAGLILAILGITGGVGVAIALDARTRGEYRFAVGCFAFSALMIAASIVVWGVNGEVFDMKSIIATAVMFAAIGVGLIAAIRWTRGRHERASESHATKNEETDSPKDDAPMSEFGSNEIHLRVGQPVNIPIAMIPKDAKPGTKIGPFNIHVDGPKHISFKDNALMTSDAILDFLVTREKGAPPYPSSNDPATWSRQQASLRAYDAQTLTLFTERLGKDAIYTHDELLKRGFQDPTLDRLYNDPATTAGIKVIGQKLRYLAEQLAPDEPQPKQTNQSKHPKPDSKVIAPPIRSLENSLSINFRAGAPYQIQDQNVRNFRIGVRNTGGTVADNVAVRLINITPHPRDLMAGTAFPYSVFTSTGREFVGINPDDEEKFSIARSWIASDSRVIIAELYGGQNSTKRDWISIDQDEVWQVLFRVTAANTKPVEIKLEMRAGKKSVEVRKLPL
jgi:hypothetical protein